MRSSTETTKKKGGNMDKKTMVVGIMPLKDMRRYTMAIACGKHTPSPDEPKVWFESEKVLAQVLCAENKALLQMIIEREPQSISELAEMSGRVKGNLSRTLKKMQNLGLVVIQKNGKRHAPKAVATDFTIRTSIDKSHYPAWMLESDDEGDQRFMTRS